VKHNDLNRIQNISLEVEVENMTNVMFLRKMSH